MAVALTTPYSILYCSSEIFKYERNVIGRGRSPVFPGIFVGKNVAVKRIEVTSLTEDEFEHHSKLKHENVVELLEVINNLDFRFMVLELCSGTLLQVIQKTFDGPALPTDREVMYQIAAGLAYVHSQNLVHLDIKPENILISTKGQVKLADFGLSMKTINGVCILSGNMRGTFPWMAPEVFGQGGENSVATVSPMADIFSCGCVFLVFLSRENGGIHPFGNCWRSRETTQCNIRKGKQENVKNLEHLPDANLILRMIESEPNNRCSIEEVKNNLRDPASSSSIPSNMNKNTSHQAQQEQPHPSFESHEMMEETSNQQNVPNKPEELLLPQLPRDSINGHSHNDGMEGDADKAGSDDNVKIGRSNKSNGEDTQKWVGNVFEQEAEPGPTTALSGCNSSSLANGSVKPKLKQKVVTNRDEDCGGQEEDVRKVEISAPSH